MTVSRKQTEAPGRIEKPNSFVISLLLWTLLCHYFEHERIDISSIKRWFLFLIAFQIENVRFFYCSVHCTLFRNVSRARTSRLRAQLHSQIRSGYSLSNVNYHIRLTLNPCHCIIDACSFGCPPLVLSFHNENMTTSLFIQNILLSLVHFSWYRLENRNFFYWRAVTSMWMEYFSSEAGDCMRLTRCQTFAGIWHNLNYNKTAKRQQKKNRNEMTRRPITIESLLFKHSDFTSLCNFTKIAGNNNAIEKYWPKRNWDINS